MDTQNFVEGDDKLMRQLLREYFPENLGTDTDILTLIFLEKLKYNDVRSLSLKNEKVCKDWKTFLSNLPFSSEEIVLHPLEKFWRFKMYRKYIPKERTDFRKKMKAGPDFDQLGRFPITGEDMRLYRHSCNK